jgi:hypothetical protein
MTTSVHGKRRVYSGATHAPRSDHHHGWGTHKPPGPKRQVVAWLDCSADEFIRLLAQHEAGEINLLDMAGVVPDEAVEVEEEPAEENPSHPDRLGNGGAINRVLALLKSSRRPLTPRRISELTGLELRSVRGALNARKKMMTREMTENGYAWRLNVGQ